MVRILAKGILLLKGSEEILRLRTVACSKVLQFLENVFEELQLLVRDLLPGDGCLDCNLRREGHWKDAILLLRYGLVDLARTAGMLGVRLPLQIEDLVWESALLINYSDRVGQARPCGTVAGSARSAAVGARFR